MGVPKYAYLGKLGFPAHLHLITAPIQCVCIYDLKTEMDGCCWFNFTQCLNFVWLLCAHAPSGSWWVVLHFRFSCQVTLHFWFLLPYVHFEGGLCSYLHSCFLSDSFLHAYENCTSLCWGDLVIFITVIPFSCSLDFVMVILGSVLLYSWQIFSSASSTVGTAAVRLSILSKPSVTLADMLCLDKCRCKTGQSIQYPVMM